MLYIDRRQYKTHRINILFIKENFKKYNKKYEISRKIPFIMRFFNN